jgi:hypothetical protein
VFGTDRTPNTDRGRGESVLGALLAAAVALVLTFVVVFLYDRWRRP